MRNSKIGRNLLSLLITLVVGFVYFYVRLPALNFHTEDFYTFVIMLCVVYTAAMIVLEGFRAESIRGFARYAWEKIKFPFVVGLAMVAVILIGSAFGLVIFRAGAYSSLMPVKAGDFTKEVAEISMTQIPMLDEASANILANRKLGELSELVSQFSVNDSSAQINYGGKPVRVTYLNYENFFKWWKNSGKGIPAYMLVDMATQEVDVVRLEEGIKYSPSEYFNRDLYRHLRFSYPTFLFDNINFEVDEEGTPYWVASVIEKKIGLFNGDDVKGVVLLNAITGDSQYYPISDVPMWVDRAYSAGLIIDQYNYYGRYKNGFFNSLFSQTDCTTTTTGYNYIAMSDDVWLYTGITSISEDRGNIGFILVNQRTKDARYYSCAGAEEYSAMSSAEGAVQQFSYDATFPLLLNISDEPTYFMALKDAAGLVKMYAMVNVQQYQIVATGNSLAQCQNSYHELLFENGLIEDVGEIIPEEDVQTEEEKEVATDTLTGVISDIRTVTIDGNTCLYLLLDNNDLYYVISAKDNPGAVILNPGDEVSIEFYPGTETEGICTGIKVTLMKKKTVSEETAVAEETATAEEGEENR